MKRAGSTERAVPFKMARKAGTGSAGANRPNAVLREWEIIGIAARPGQGRPPAAWGSARTAGYNLAMAGKSMFLDPDGVPFWVQQRARRLARGGKTVSAISSALRINHGQVRRYLEREPRYERCPTCGGMVLTPCAICAMRGY